MPVREMLTQIGNSDQHRPVRIEVCGGIASGKTTFASLLGTTGMNVVLENFQANPFLDLFYSDMSKFAFETEITFLLQHFCQIKTESLPAQTVICDFSFYLDIAYASVTLADSKNQAFKAVYDEVQRELVPPAILVHLRCGAATELERIRSRNRLVEQSISIEFLSDLNESLNHYVDQVRQKTRVLEVDSERVNFATDVSAREDMVTMILDSLRFTHTTVERP
jgi:deoxyadenosine/deoxycytidine kinase